MKNKNEIKLNKNIYDKKAIEKTIESFSHLADFVLGETGNYYIIKFIKKMELDESDLMDEFSNYALYSMKSL